MACTSQNDSKREKGDMAFLHVRLAYQILKHKTAVLRSKKGSEMKDLF